MVSLASKCVLVGGVVLLSLVRKFESLEGSLAVMFEEELASKLNPPTAAAVGSDC